MGIAVSKKIGSKPRRNKLKRRFRAAIASAPDLLEQRLDFVIVVNAEASEAAFESVEKEVRALFTMVIKRWADELESS